MHVHCGYQALSLYNIITINYYGLFIVLGILVSFYFLTKNRLYTPFTSHPQFPSLINVMIVAGIIGGRLVTVLSEREAYAHFYDWFNIALGGFSALGSILGVLATGPLFLYYNRMPLLPLCDAVALYAPLFQAIARIGCFIVGCCHGISTDSFLSVMYTHPHTLASCSTAVHPTQLYSALLLFMIFLLLRYLSRTLYKRPGLLFTLYLVLASLERFFVDFWRADRIMIASSGIPFSVHQCIALFLIIVSGSLGIYITSQNKNYESI